MSETKDEISWKTINKMFNDNPDFFIKHHLDSYNQFFNQGIKEIFKSNNPLTLFKDQDTEAGIYKHNLEMYFGGKNGDKIYYGKPIIYDEQNNTTRQHYMYPNEARLRNMSYQFTIHYDVEIIFTIYVEKENSSGQKGLDKYDKKTHNVLLEKKFLGKFPIMLFSDRCILKKLEPEVRFNMGECRNDYGGYFIIDGKEKVIVSQEGRANNVLYIKENKKDNAYSHAAEIKSVSENASKPQRTLSVRILAPTPTYTNKQIVVNIPNVRKPIPLFIVMRALGVVSDKEIIETCLLDMDKNENFIELFRPSVHHAGEIFTQDLALHYIGLLTKGTTRNSALQILMDYFLPHIGELNFKMKAFYLGYIVKRLINVYVGLEKPTNRDKYSYKRIETPGNLLYQLFREYYLIQVKKMHSILDQEYFWKQQDKGITYQNENFRFIIERMEYDLFKEKIVERGLRKAFKGDWGSEIHTKRAGIVQDLTRLSYFATLCQLRKTNLNIGDGTKMLGPRHLNATQYGLLCPVHSPDGGKIGLHKHLALSTSISNNISPSIIIPVLRLLGVKLLEECSISYISKYTKVFINGIWLGMTMTPIDIVNYMKLYRRNDIIDKYICINFDFKLNEINIHSDGGRPCRPLFYMIDDYLSYQRPEVIDKFKNNKISWHNLVNGFLENKEKYKIVKVPNFDDADIDEWHLNLYINSSVVEYIDALEGESMKLGHSQKDDLNHYKKNKITHEEIHPSLIFGVMGNMIIFPEHNPCPRNHFSCGQGKQAVSIYHSNYRNRVDKSALYLNYGQIPLTKSRYWNYIGKGEHAYGENAIVAIMCYTGFNVEDAVILNKDSLERGLFSTTKISVYESFEEIQNIDGIDIKTIFLNVENNNVIQKKPGFDYSKLDKTTGLIKEGSFVNDKTVLIGKAIQNPDMEDQFLDTSITPKKGEMGIVEKAFITHGEEGKRIAKIKIRCQRMPAIGDKFCSRAGQKGTIGIILNAIDMPTTAEGLVPDIIVNPHAMPSRMTIGHLVETITSKLAVVYGSFGDCTTFNNKGPQHKIYGEYLMKEGYEKNGHDVLYNGMTGEQLEADIYIGPTYYLRLKHMPKDKINYRARGPRQVLTRQTVGGRANNGGLRIGEMGRDAVIAHGLAHFMEESMMVRGDEFYVAICNQTGCIAAYNENKNIFLSLYADGPLKFTKNIEGGHNLNNVKKHGRTFSIVRVPYAFKLLIQEVKCMNVQMRIITDQNVDQLLNLTKSNNLKDRDLKFYNVIGKQLKNKLESEKMAAELEKFYEQKKIEEEVKQVSNVINAQWNQTSYDDGEFGSNFMDTPMMAPGMMSGMPYDTTGMPDLNDNISWSPTDNENIQKMTQKEIEELNQSDVWKVESFVNHNGEKYQIIKDMEDGNVVIKSTSSDDQDMIEYPEIVLWKDDDELQESPLDENNLTIKKPSDSSPKYVSTLPSYEANQPQKGGADVSEAEDSDSDSDEEGGAKPVITIHDGINEDGLDLLKPGSVDDIDKDLKDSLENDPDKKGIRIDNI